MVTAEPVTARGRFAPSPTGPLHLGSLLAAVGSYLDARARRGEWLVRIEDVDRSREVPGAADGILRTLERYGLTWDGPVIRQSEREPLYESALADLAAAGLTYPCSCTRAEIGDPADSGIASADRRYPGRCRQGPASADGPFATRFRVDGFGPETVVDRVQPSLTQHVDAVTGDVVLKRRDGFFAYQLAVVVDDAEQGISDVVRGLDLYDNTPRQRLLQRALKLPAPSYLHLPLIVDRDGGKLAKSRRALPVAIADVPATLSQVLTWLRQPLPEMLHHAAPQEQLTWAISHWNPQLFQGVDTISVDG